MNPTHNYDRTLVHHNMNMIVNVLHEDKRLNVAHNLKHAKIYYIHSNAANVCCQIYILMIEFWILKAFSLQSHSKVRQIVNKFTFGWWWYLDLGKYFLSAGVGLQLHSYIKSIQSIFVYFLNKYDMNHPGSDAD